MRSRTRPWLALLSFCAAVAWLSPPTAAALDRAGVAAFSQEATDNLAMADRHAAAGRHFQAARAYRHAIDLGLDGTDVRFRLSLALYGLGLVDEAIGEINQAQQLSPEANFLHLPSGILYLANGDFALAAQQFTAALRINPGFADAYYYLGEAYYRQGDYPRAWLSCRMAQLLGHPGDGLQRKLPGVAAPPDAIPWRVAADVVHLRAIPVGSLAEGQSVLGRIAAGELFETIATERGTEASQGFGGYVGSVLPADLDPIIVEALLDREPFHPPVLLETAGGLQVIQWIASFDPDYWDQLLPPIKPVARAGTQAAKPIKTAAVAKPVEAIKSAEPVVAAKPAVTETTYSLIFTGTYTNDKTAQAKLQALKEHGFPAYIYRQENESGMRHHVIAGKYPTHQEALRAATQLQALKVDYFISESRQRGGTRSPAVQAESAPTPVMKLPDGTPSQYRLYAGSFNTEAAARKQVETLQQQGFPSYLFQKESPSGRSFHVVAGKYSSRQDADLASSQLKALGVAHYLSAQK
jgi:cell division septation protein DedD